MPALPTHTFPSKSSPDKLGSKDANQRQSSQVPVSVNQRVKVMNNSTWLTRTSYHLDSDVKYAELDALLSQDHSLNEARYTPSVLDAIELLKWAPEDLRTAVDALSQEHRIERVQMCSMFSAIKLCLVMLQSRLGALNCLE